MGGGCFGLTKFVTEVGDGGFHLFEFFIVDFGRGVGCVGRLVTCRCRSVLFGAVFVCPVEVFFEFLPFGTLGDWEIVPFSKGFWEDSGSFDDEESCSDLVSFGNWLIGSFGEFGSDLDLIGDFFKRGGGVPLFGHAFVVLVHVSGVAFAIFVAEVCQHNLCGGFI